MSSGAGSPSVPVSLGGTPSTTSLATTSATSATATASASSSSYATNASASNTTVSAGASPSTSLSASATALQDTDENRHEAALLQKLLDISRHRHHTLTSQILGNLTAYNSNMEQDLTYIIKQYIQTKMTLEKSQAEVKRLEQANAELISSKRISSSETQVGLGITSHQPSNLMHSSGTLQQQLLHMGQLHFQAIQEQQSKLDATTNQLQEQQLLFDAARRQIQDQQSLLDAATNQIQEQQSRLNTAGCELQMTTQELIRALEDVEQLKSKVASLETQLETLDSTRTELESTNQNKIVVNQQLAVLLEARMRDLEVARSERDQARRAMDAAVHELIETRRKFQYYQRMLAPYLMANMAQGQAVADVSSTLLPSWTAPPAAPQPGTFPANGPWPNVPHIAFSPKSLPVGPTEPEGLLPYQGPGQPLVQSSGMSTQSPSSAIQTPATGALSTVARIEPIATSAAVIPVSTVPVPPRIPMIPATAMQASTPPFAGTPGIAGVAPPASFAYTAPYAPPSNVQLNTSLTLYGPSKAPKAPKAPKALKAPKPKGAAAKVSKSSSAVWKEPSIPPPAPSKSSPETPAANVTRVSFSERAPAPTSSLKEPSASAHRQPLAVIDLTANSTEVITSSPQAALSSPSPYPSSSQTAIPTTQSQPQSQPQPQTPAQPQTQPLTQPQTQPQTQSQTQPQIQPQTQPQTQPQVQAQSLAQSQPQTQEETQQQTQQQIQPQPPAQPQTQPQLQLQPEKQSMGFAHLSHLLQEQQQKRLLKQQEIQRLQSAIKEIAESTKLSHQAQQERLNERDEEHLKQIHDARVASHLAQSRVSGGVDAPLASVIQKTAPGSNGAFIVAKAATGSSAPQGEKRQLEVDSGDEFENHRMQGGNDVTSPKRVAAAPLPHVAVEKTGAASPVPAIVSPETSTPLTVVLPRDPSPDRPALSKIPPSKPMSSKASSITVASFEPVMERIKTAKFPAFEAAPSRSPPPVQLPQRLLDSGLKTKKQRRSVKVWTVDESGEEEDEEEEEEEEEEEDSGKGQKQQVVSSLQRKRPSFKRFKPQPGRWYASAVVIPVRPRHTSPNSRSSMPSGTGAGAVDVGGDNAGAGVHRAVVAEKESSDRRGSTTSIISSQGTHGTPIPGSRSSTVESSKSTGAGLSSSLVMRTANTTLTSTGNLSQTSKDVRAWVHSLSDDDGDDSTETDEEYATEAVLEQGYRLTNPIARPVQVAPASSSPGGFDAQTTSPSDMTAPKTQGFLQRTSSFLVKLSEAAAAKRNVEAGSLATIDLSLGGDAEDAMETDP